ncbi:efflux RND transporter periplasmic adaptor subunit [Sphingorhabdus sp. SMR4y]|uniref:efflux RND transporter periplasmic adaptor subunit n=1 Tax=Sphingorhabdus sp. SMR4y TaxID=2584094 RepID=UPI000B5CAD5F|nr:efflux RND transporter periplasmic adaptor subunit [Sphingorhabdus sp. SMR4y]ASK89658.1 cation efflux system protein CusB [Sphingorhabdus sp. SMR4y]
MTKISLSSRQRTIAGVAAVALVGVAAGYGLSFLGGADDGNGNATAVADCEEVLYWYDPMVPGQRFDKPGKSPFMDMQLVPKCAGGGADQPGVSIDPALVQNLGIRTAVAERGMLETETTVTGTIAYNAREMAVVQPRSSGFVQRTYGLAPDDVVRRGAPLVDLLIPEWGGAQREYLAVAATGDKALTGAARQRLQLLGMPESMISAVARSGRPRSVITITAPVSGAVTMLAVRPGMSVNNGQTLAEITGLNPIWLEVAVPEIQAGDVRIGQTVRATLTAYPGELFTGRITAILPSAQADSRTLTLRAEIPNPNLRLRPGMFASVSLSPDRREAVLIPSEAVIRTGKRTLVMLAQGEGGFRPAEIRIGRDASGKTEVLAGLTPGEKVVVSGQFLLDSEASLGGVDVRPIDEAAQAGNGKDAGDQQKLQRYSADGTIEKITARSVTLRHGPVSALDWPAMTMAFAIEKPAQLRGFKRGDKVTFRFIQADSGPQIISIRKRGQ